MANNNSNTQARSIDSIVLEVHVFPINNSKDNSLAVANVTVDNTVAMRGLRVINSEKGPFVTMPQTRDAKGDYKDICFPVLPGLRQKISEAVLAEYTAVKEKEVPSVSEQLKDSAKKAKEKAPEKKEKTASKTELSR